MTTGAVIFAQNNSRIDYVKMAIHAATHVKKHLNIPVSLITENKDYLESKYPDHPFDKIIDIPFQEPMQVKRFYDGTLSSNTLTWKNNSRSSVYELTPYEKTLVIDSDYIINSPMLLSAINNDSDFQIFRRSLDLAGFRDTTDFQRINQYSIPFYWATVFIFQKSVVMEAFFNIVEYIRDNWFYFKALYNITSNTFRNDIAFSIAIHIMNGKTNGEFATELPGSLVYAMDTDFLVSTDSNKMKFLVEKQNYLGEYTLVKTTGLDVHVMNKYSLSRYIDGGSGV